MNVCIIDNCEQKRHGRGYCNKHYARILANGTLETKTERHGLHGTPEYLIWADMKTRCYNKKRPCYDRYGGRGIRVCKKWKESFLAFIGDVGKRPGPEYSIDRIDNDGNYEPGNVRWATKSEQAFNRRMFKNNTSGYKGVSAYGNKWMVYSNRSGKRKTIGYASTLEEAVNLRDKHEQDYS